MIGPALWLAARRCRHARDHGAVEHRRRAGRAGTLDQARVAEVARGARRRRWSGALSTCSASATTSTRTASASWAGAPARGRARSSRAWSRGFHSLVLISGGSAPSPSSCRRRPRRSEPRSRRPCRRSTRSATSPGPGRDPPAPGRPPRRRHTAQGAAAPDRRRTRGHRGALVRGRPRARPGGLRDHVRWLGERLGLDGPVVAGAKSEP